MAGQYGVKETKEAILGLVTIGKIVVDGVKLNQGLVGDAAQVVAVLLANKDVIEAAVQGADQIPKEIGELDLSDVIELAKVIPDILAKLNA